MKKWALPPGRYMLGLCIFLAWVVAVCGNAPPAIGSEGLAAAVWPMLGSSSGHTSLSGFRGPDTNQLAWRFSTNASIDGGPAIDVDGSVFFGAGDGGFFAIDQ